MISLCHCETINYFYIFSLGLFFQVDRVMIDTFLFDEFCHTSLLEVIMNRRQTRNLSVTMIVIALVLLVGMGVFAFRLLHGSTGSLVYPWKQTERLPYRESKTEALRLRSINPINAETLASHKEEVAEILRTTGPKICLTFDDGPSPAITPKLLDLLKQYNVHATFFLVGKNAERYPDLVKRMIDEGHEVGNHSYDHPQLTTLSVDGFMSQINGTNDIIYNATGVKPKYLRPPYGSKNQVMKDTIPMPFILWNVDPEDWNKTATKESISQNVLDNVSDGGIVLSHDLYERTYEAYEILIPQLIQQGYQFLTVSEMFREKGVDAVNGESYRSIR